MFAVSPLGVLAALVLVGISVEVVERKSKPAAYALVVLVLLGIITFNNKAFSQQIRLVMGLLNARDVESSNRRSPPMPQTNSPATNPGQKRGEVIGAGKA